MATKRRRGVPIIEFTAEMQEIDIQAKKKRRREISKITRQRKNEHRVRYNKKPTVPASTRKKAASGGNVSGKRRKLSKRTGEKRSKKKKTDSASNDPKQTNLAEEMSKVHLVSRLRWKGQNDEASEDQEQVQEDQEADSLSEIEKKNRKIEELNRVKVVSRLSWVRNKEKEKEKALLQWPHDKIKTPWKVSMDKLDYDLPPLDEAVLQKIPPEIDDAHMLVPPFVVSNVVATFNLGVKDIDFLKLLFDIDYFPYNPSWFAAATVNIHVETGTGGMADALRYFKATALQFMTGKMVCSATKSYHQAVMAVRSLVLLNVKNGITCNPKDFLVQNIVASADTKMSLDLDWLDRYMRLHPEKGKTSYEPALFPGLFFEPNKKRVVFLVFVSGCVVITGAKNEAQISYMLTWFYYNIMVHFKSAHTIHSSADYRAQLKERAQNQPPSMLEDLLKRSIQSKKNVSSQTSAPASKKGKSAKPNLSISDKFRQQALGSVLDIRMGDAMGGVLQNMYYSDDEDEEEEDFRSVYESKNKSASMDACHRLAYAGRERGEPQFWKQMWMAARVQRMRYFAILGKDAPEPTEDHLRNLMHCSLTECKQYPDYGVDEDGEFVPVTFRPAPIPLSFLDPIIPLDPLDYIYPEHHRKKNKSRVVTLFRKYDDICLRTCVMPPS